MAKSACDRCLQQRALSSCQFNFVVYRIGQLFLKLVILSANLFDTLYYFIKSCPIFVSLELLLSQNTIISFRYEDFWQFDTPTT